MLTSSQWLCLTLLGLPSLGLSALPGVEQEGEETKASLATWPQWRGPTRDGLASGSTWGPALSADALAETWRVGELGPSYSGPVADAERVYTTETLNKEFEVVRALSRTTGKELWRASWKGSMKVPFFAARNGSWIRSTPAVDADSLYVAGMCDVLMCLDVETGDVRWSVDFTERFDTALPPFGGVCSPLLDDSHVYIQAGASLLKLDKATGETIWRSLVDDGDMMSAGAFSSPVFAEFHGKPQLVVQSRVELAGIDLNDGSVLWSTPVKAFRGMNILTPTIFDGGVFTTAYGGRSHLFAIGEGDEGLAVETKWDGKVQGYMTSPVVIDNHAYLFLKSNRFGCINLETGEDTWTSPPTGDSYWSLAAQGNRIMALSDSGILRLIEADPTDHKVISEREVTDSESWAHVAPVGKQIFVRAQDSLIALEWKQD